MNLGSFSSLKAGQSNEPSAKLTDSHAKKIGSPSPERAPQAPQDLLTSHLSEIDTAHVHLSIPEVARRIQPPRLPPLVAIGAGTVTQHLGQRIRYRQRDSWIPVPNKVIVLHGVPP